MLDSGNRFLKPTEKLRNLQVLEEISKDSSVSQRKLSQKLDVALGVTNACLKKMVNTGLIKVKGINHKRITYYLTPKGLSEKTKLAYHFLQHTISYYAALKINISSRLDSLIKAGHRRLICYGAGEVMEVVFVILNGSSLNLSILGIVDDNKDKHGENVFGFQVQHPRIIKELRPDSVLVTSMRYKDEIIQKLSSDNELSGIGFFSL